LRFLLTGATGFVGSHLTEHLIEAGHSVTCAVRDISKPKHLSDLQCSLITFDKLFQEQMLEPFEYVIHVAGLTRALSYEEYFKANVLLTRKLLSLCSETYSDSIRKFVLVSSQAAAGPSGKNMAPVIETDTPRPVSLYGKSKLEAEQEVLKHIDRLPIVIVRPPTVFGPRDKDVLRVFKAAKLRLSPYISGPDRLVSVIYVEDLVDGLLKAAISEKAGGQIYFMANSRPVVWREFTLLVARIMDYKTLGLPFPVSIMRFAAIFGDIAGKARGTANLFRSEKLAEMLEIAWVCSSEKAYRELDWKPRLSLEDAILKTGRWYKDKGWI
jgi:nucleoside-diphosphate-sugar epimerase